MKSLVPLIGANLRNGYRNKAALGVMLAFSLFFIVGFVALIYALAILPQLKSTKPDASVVSRYLALLAFGGGFIAMGMNLNVFTANSLVKEKAQRIYESILGGPVGVREFWLAKSLAIFLPGLAFCEFVSIAILLGVGGLLIGPGLGPLVSPMMLFNVLALIPILYLPLGCLVILVGLVGNPVSGNVIANIAFSALITVAINLVTRGGVDMRSPAFAAWSLSLALAVGILVLVLQLRLSKERIVLSCRS